MINPIKFILGREMYQKHCDNRFLRQPLKQRPLRILLIILFMSWFGWVLWDLWLRGR